VLKSIQYADFIVSMVGYFRDDYMIYFILDFIRGKELFDVIRDMGN